MTRITSVLQAALLAALVVPVFGQAGGDLTVTATLSHKVAVDETHEIWVFLFDSPEVTPASRPLAVDAIRKNGASVTFKNVTGTVYVRTAFDEQGDYNPQLGPPIGLPIGMYTIDEKTPAPVKAAPGAKVSIRFNDAVRYQP
jgi:hypothetical protein